MRNTNMMQQEQQVVATKWAALKSKESQPKAGDIGIHNPSKKSRNCQARLKWLISKPIHLIKRVLPQRLTSSQVFLVQLLIQLCFWIPQTKLANCDLQLQQQQQPFFTPEMETRLQSQLDEQKAFEYLVEQANLELPPTFDNQFREDLDIEGSRASVKHQDKHSKLGSSPEPNSESEDKDELSRPGSASLIAEQISALTNLLDHMGPQVNSGLTDTLLPSITDNILSPVKKSPSASLTSRKSTTTPKPKPHRSSTSSAATSTGGTSTTRSPIVGQSIDGGIEYDPNQNAINGFIDLPFNFSLGRPSMNVIKPLLFAAIKKAPLKLGSVGWKILQLIAFKKIYKAHHPKSGEIVFEHELSPALMRYPSSSKHLSSSMGDFGGLFAASSTRPRKTSKIGQIYAAGLPPPSSPMASAATAGIRSMLVQSAREQAINAASLALQRHLLASGLYMPGFGQTTSGVYPAGLAAATAAAAALQAQWSAAASSPPIISIPRKHAATSPLVARLPSLWNSGSGQKNRHQRHLINRLGPESILGQQQQQILDQQQYQNLFDGSQGVQFDSTEEDLDVSWPEGRSRNSLLRPSQVVHERLADTAEDGSSNTPVWPYDDFDEPAGLMSNETSWRRSGADE